MINDGFHPLIDFFADLLFTATVLLTDLDSAEELQDAVEQRLAREAPGQQRRSRDERE